MMQNNSKEQQTDVAAPLHEFSVINGNEPTQKLVPLLLPEILRDGLDEMNFAEFPLGVAGARVNPGQKTLTYEDKILDASQGKEITRRVTVTGSDAFGLPTASDDEVFLALIQLTKQQCFISQVVYFTRYQLVKMLGWSLGGKSYQRIEDSLKRLHGVSLYYDNAWRDKSTNSWKSENFHILDWCSIDQAENEKSRPKPNPKQENFEFATSKFKWNDVIYQSLKNGNVKSLDFSFFLSLKSSVTRRLFRFLDKRFYHRKTLEFDVKVLMFNHIGLFSKTPIGSVKRQLSNAIDELERNGYLKPIPEERRYHKIKAGYWKVVFERADYAVLQKTPDTDLNAALVAALTNQGIAIPKAKELVSKFPEPLIREKLDIFKWLKKENDKRISQNPPGFLVASIEQNYAVPQNYADFKKVVHTKETEKKKQESQVTKEQKRVDKINAANQQKQEIIKNFWENLSPEAKEQAKKEARSKANTFQQETIAKGGITAASVIKNLEDEFALDALSQG